jgi:hypothetical protein
VIKIQDEVFMDMLFIVMDHRLLGDPKVKKVRHNGGMELLGQQARYSVGPNRFSLGSWAIIQLPYFNPITKSKKKNNDKS